MRGCPKAPHIGSGSWVVGCVGSWELNLVFLEMNDPGSWTAEVKSNS